MKRRSTPEEDLQRQCVRWFRLQYPKLKLIHIPNGGYRTKAEAGIFKALGVEPGVADLLLIEARKDCHALFIELKREKGKVSDNQQGFGNYCMNHQFGWVVCRNIDQFMTAVNTYINNP